MTAALRVREITGNLLDQPVEALVKPWIKNFMPRLLLQAGMLHAPGQDAGRLKDLGVSQTVDRSPTPPSM